MQIACETGLRKTITSCPKIVRFSPTNGDLVAVVLDEPGSIMLNHNSNWSILKLSDDIFDIDFFPGFNTDIPETKTMIVSSRNRPIQLIRCVDGAMLSAYPAYSFTDEIVHPLSVKFEPISCGTIIGGFQSSTVRVWDVQRPGRQIRDLVFATRRETGTGSIKGIVSAVNYWNTDTVVAGTYSKIFGMFDIRDKNKGMMFGQNEKMGGIVQIESLASRNLVITNHRNEFESIRVWDVRKPESCVKQFKRKFSNHQRSSFGVYKERFIVAGDIDGKLHAFDIDDSRSEPVISLEVAPGSPTVGVDVNPSGKIAVASGARKFEPTNDSSSESDTELIGEYRVDFFNCS